MQGYFDIHSHILPGVDDGPKNMDETRRMLLLAYEEGIRIIVATPHFIAGKKNIAVNDLIRIYDQVTKVAANVSKEFQIILGNELFYNLQLLEALKSGEALTIDGTRYILVEFSKGTSFREMWEGVNNCIFAGYIPILAHVERYPCLVKDSDLVGDLIKLGAYIQLNVSCISGKESHSQISFGRRLLQRGWIHFLGTDTHGISERAPHMKDAAAYLEKKFGLEAKQRLLWDNPMTMVEDRHL